MHEVGYVVRALVATLIVRDCAVAALSLMHEQDENICKSVESFCGSANCSARSNIQSFVCECGKYHYFNATARKCYHIASCLINPCHLSSCDDNDGKSEARCVCEEGPLFTSDCKPKATFMEKCASIGGRLKAYSDGNGPVKCVCPRGTLLDKGMCQSIACLFPNLTCGEICADPKLREDSRCCQGWEAGSCNEPHGSGPNCEPGTIWSVTSNTCKNACSAGLAEAICKHGCNALDEITSNYTCQCADGEELSTDGLSCNKKESCSDEEIKQCAERGRQCIFRDLKVQCRCPGSTLDLDGRCSDNCTVEKMRECAGPLSRCVIEGNKETCVCPEPLLWNHTSKQCIPEEQFRYVTKFKLYHDTSEENDGTQDPCNDPELTAVVQNAMKNLYGLDLVYANVTKCSDAVTVELIFRNEAPGAVLRRLHLCEERAGATGCLFQPSLRIFNGSVSDPVPVDLCLEHFQNVFNTSNGFYYCSKEGIGRYVLRCVDGKVTQSIRQGYLQLQLCHDTEIIKEADSWKWNTTNISLAGLAAVFIVAFVAVVCILCCRRRYCYYRIPQEDPNGGVVRYARTTQPEGQTLDDAGAAVQLKRPS